MDSDPTRAPVKLKKALLLKSQVYEKSIGRCQKNCGKLHPEELTQTVKHMFSVAEIPLYSKSE